MRNITPHPPHNPDFSPSNFHLFGPLKEFLGGKKFSTDDEVKRAVLRMVQPYWQIFLCRSFPGIS